MNISVYRQSMMILIQQLGGESRAIRDKAEREEAAGLTLNI